MNIRPKIGADCLAAAKAASGEKLTDDEISEAFQRVGDYKRKLEISGEAGDLQNKLREFAAREAERTKIAAAMQKRHAALNVLVRQRLDAATDSFIKAGLTPKQAVLAIMEGTQHGVEGGRNSVASLNLAYEARYLGSLMAEIQRDRPHLAKILHRDKLLDADIAREMNELKDGGNPGVTGNDDARYLAKVFSTYAELSRTDLNSLGASIGKLDGWSGHQSHDDMKMIRAGKDAWVEFVVGKLDVDRTFPDLTSPAEVRNTLGEIYDTIITGVPNKPTAREKGQRVNPANLAKSLGKSRVLHFRDANVALAYREQFGNGSTASGIFEHLRRAARLAANMDALGPNPEIMIGSVVENLKRKTKERADLSDAVKNKQIKALDSRSIQSALDVATGLTGRPDNLKFAQISAGIRAVVSMAKLGGSVLSSIGDNVTAAAASQFRGSGFFNGLVAQLDGLRQGRPKGEVAEISYLLGEGFDGIVGQITAPNIANDGPPGFAASLQEKFFRWNAQAWWTDVSRGTASRVISAEMGMRAAKSFEALPDNYRHVLGLHGIDATKWEAIRKAGVREVNGNNYITPDLIRSLPDEDISSLVASRLEGKKPEQQAAIIERARRDLELDVLKFFADQTNYAIVETDARSRRTTTQGYRPGTFGGEAIRFVMQFKGFPMAFTQRVMGRAVFGHRAGASVGEKAAHIGTLLAGMTMAGYASLVMKDMVKGYWPPRDPTDPATWAAAFVQGGGAGIYGDFLFSKVNRFGGGFTETMIGPTLGAAGDFVDLILKARDAALSSDEEVRLADYVNFGLQNTPFINLFYTRPALDYLFLNSLREAASPGFNRRQERKRLADYGQESFMPDHVKTFGR